MVRDAVASDYPAIQEIHRLMGMDYQLPPLDSPLFFVKKVVEDDSGRVIGACFLRVLAETYLWLNPDTSPRDKMNAMGEMQPAILDEACHNGIELIEARIPEETERRFLKRLKQLGWQKNRSGWNPWSRLTERR
jgi:hypothetical protein